MSLWFLHAAPCHKISFIFKVKLYLIVCVYHIFFIHLAVARYLGCYHILAIVNKGAMNTGVKMSLQDTDFTSFGGFGANQTMQAKPSVFFGLAHMSLLITYC